MTAEGTMIGAGEASGAAVDWELMERWDRSYYQHVFGSGADPAWPAVAYQEGSWLHMADGSRLLDFQSQLTSDHMGHRHPRVVEGVRQALDRYGHVYFPMATDYRARAAKLLIEDILGQDDWAGRVRLLASGSDAITSSLLMARIATERPLVLTQANSFHGSTAAHGTRLVGYHGQLSSPTEAGQLRDEPGYPGTGFVTIPVPEPEEFDASGGLPSLVETERLIVEAGPENVAAVITETIFGVGCWFPHPDYLPGLRELTRRHGILWIADEIVCGFGRLGRWFSYQLYDNLRPDLMVIGKGMNGCILPSGGVVASRELAELFERNRWCSGSTWDAHPVVAASIVANVEVMLEEKIVERGAEMGVYLAERLRELRPRHSTLGRIAGRGMYYVLDLVDRDGVPIVPADRNFDFTGDMSNLPTRIVGRECARLGVLCGGFFPNSVKVAPPLTVSREEVDIGIEALDAALDEVDRRYG